MQRLSRQLGQENSPLERLYQRYWLVLFTAICQHVQKREDAEDILLDVFLAAIESSTLMSLPERLQEAWLRRVAYNKCMDFHRRNARHPAQTLEQQEETLVNAEQLAPEWATLRQEELAQLRAHLATLSPPQQELLRLRFANELSCAQIAAHMHKSEGAIRTMLSRTLNRLRAIYTKKEDSHHD